MLDVIALGPLMSPALGVWDLIVDSPEAGIALVAALFTMAMAGIALAIFGARHRQDAPAQVPVVVQGARPRRRGRRRRSR
jgi:hypothetical protein